MPPTLTKEEQSTLIQKAISAKSSAYCPYSSFRVGATLLLHHQNPSSHGERGGGGGGGGGDYISGANIENVSFPVGTCAERVAFGNAVFSSPTSTTASTAGDKEGGGRVKVKAVAVASDKSPGVSPCGMCRQFMREFTTADVPVYLVDKDGKFVVRSMGELLPDSFGPDDLH